MRLLLVCFFLLVSCQTKKQTSQVEANPEPLNSNGPVKNLICPEDYPLNDLLSSLPQIAANLENPQGHEGASIPPLWNWDDIRLFTRWSSAVLFEMDWVSTSERTRKSLRTDPIMIPRFGFCLVKQIQPEKKSVLSLPESLALQAGLVRNNSQFNQWQLPVADFKLSNQDNLFNVLNALAGGDEQSWRPVLKESLRNAIATYPEDLKIALSSLLHELLAATTLKKSVFSSESLARSAFESMMSESYTNTRNMYVKPGAELFLKFAESMEHEVFLDEFSLASQRIANATMNLYRVFKEQESNLKRLKTLPVLDLVTPHGQILIDFQDSGQTRKNLENILLLVDGFGDDIYEGHFASTHRWNMSASIVIDFQGNDSYGPNTPDLKNPSGKTADVFSNQFGFTQGSGLFGIGMLFDFEGKDDYRASIFSQGVGVFGVGLLFDSSGDDEYSLAYMGQGAGFFGTGQIRDEKGNDKYTLYTLGQGVGKTRGHGLLLDLDGHDEYICLPRADLPVLADRKISNYYSLKSDFAYNRDGVPHYPSVCQGVGWGYRHNWVETANKINNPPPETSTSSGEDPAEQAPVPEPSKNWAGGLGLLIDLGQGNDTHEADVFSMGYGLVYGVGMLYDEGGDDSYSTFWWGPAASAHMGIGIFIENAGNDTVYTSRASGGLGFDLGHAWAIDLGGNDRYGGEFNYGDAYTNGMSFFVNIGGQDQYNVAEPTSPRNNPPFGIVRNAFKKIPMLGLFLDLGCEQDIYNTSLPEIANNKLWRLAPQGETANPDLHKGIGLDLCQD